MRKIWPQITTRHRGSEDNPSADVSRAQAERGPEGPARAGPKHPTGVIAKQSGVRGQSICRRQSSRWIVSPLLSFGSNHVVLGGIILPESAMSTSCFIETG